MNDWRRGAWWCAAAGVAATVLALGMAPPAGERTPERYVRSGGAMTWDSISFNVAADEMVQVAEGDGTLGALIMTNSGPVHYQLMDANGLLLTELWPGANATQRLDVNVRFRGGLWLQRLSSAPSSPGFVSVLYLTDINGGGG